MDAQTMARLDTSSQAKPCPLCGGDDHTVVSTRDRNGSALRNVMCATCGHVFISPAPSEEELKAYYTEHYRTEYKGVITPKRKHVLRAGLRALERLSRLQPYITTPSRVLDVGAGGGEFAYLLSCAGHTVTGIEPNAGYAEFARQSYGLDIQTTTLELSDFESESFAVITLHHVLEHVADPRNALKKFWHWLKPSGLMIVEVPNAVSWFHAPRRRFHAAHLHTFNQLGLEDIFKAAGFRVEDLHVAAGTGHLNIVARKEPARATSATFRSAADNVLSHFQRHTELTHIFSGMALTRLWGNALRPWRERKKLSDLGNPHDARAILDRLFAPALM